MTRLRFSIEGAMIVVGCFALLFLVLRLERNHGPLTDLAIVSAGATAGALLQRYKGGRGVLGGALGGMLAPLAWHSAEVLWYRLNPQLNTSFYVEIFDMLFWLFNCAIIGAVEGLVIWSVLSNPRLPRVRITIPRVVAGVAIIAIALGVEIGLISKWRRQSAAYQERAAAYAELTLHIGHAVLDRDGQWVERDPILRARDAWAMAMAEKYWRLAAYPWLPVEPDSPYPPDVIPFIPEPRITPVRGFMVPYRPRRLRDVLTFLWNWPD